MHPCKAITAKGKPCQRFVIDGDYCELHSGRLVPSKYADALPAQLASNYLENFNNPEILSLRHEIALVDTRIEMLISQLQTGESIDAWQQIQHAVQQHQHAADLKDMEQQKHWLNQIRALTENSKQLASVWSAVHILIEQRRRLVDTDQKVSAKNRADIRAQKLEELMDAWPEDTEA